MKVADVATPEAFVTAKFVPSKLPLAPAGGAVNLTVTPGTGLPNASCTSTVNGTANAELISALFPDPATTVRSDAAPAVFVSEKAVAVPTPGADAVTE
jgi:hypothetical protein